MSLTNFHYLIWYILDSDARDSMNDPKLTPVVYATSPLKPVDSSNLGQGLYKQPSTHFSFSSPSLFTPHVCLHFS
jgi:hypothetical protein